MTPGVVSPRMNLWTPNAPSKMPQSPAASLFPDAWRTAGSSGLPCARDLPCWRTPHLGQISARARIISPHSWQCFSSEPRLGGGSWMNKGSIICGSTGSTDPKVVFCWGGTGTCRRCPHFGQLIFRPAWSSVVENDFTQLGQLKLIIPPLPRRVLRRITAQLSSRLTREKTLNSEKPSIAWPVCCSDWFGARCTRTPRGFVGDANGPEKGAHRR